MKKASPLYENFFQLRRAAYQSGKPCIPVKDMDFMNLAYNTPRPATAENFRQSAEHAKAWIGGWTIENLKGDYQHDKTRIYSTR